MLARIIQRGLLGANKNFLGCCAKRCFSNEYSPYLPGGGLEKLQGGFKEESYFKLNDYKLMLKVREQTLREGGYDTSHLRRALDAVDNEENVNEAMQEAHHHAYHPYQGLMNKHKNSSEESFFLTEEADNLRRLENKMRQEVETKLRQQLTLKMAQQMQEELAERMETLPKMHKFPEFK